MLSLRLNMRGMTENLMAVRLSPSMMNRRKRGHRRSPIHTGERIHERWRCLTLVYRTGADGLNLHGNAVLIMQEIGTATDEG